MRSACQSAESRGLQVQCSSLLAASHLELSGTQRSSHYKEGEEEAKGLAGMLDSVALVASPAREHKEAWVARVPRPDITNRHH